MAPGDTAHLKLVLVAQREFGPELAHCRDRFLVQSIPLMPEQVPDSALFRTHKLRVHNTKLRVNVVRGAPCTHAREPVVCS